MIMKILSNQKGVSIVAAVVTLILLTIMGTAIVSLVIGGQESRVAQLRKDRAFYIWQAGTEYAMKEIDNGGWPEVEDNEFGEGSFTVDVSSKHHLKEVWNRTGNTPIVYEQSALLGTSCINFELSSVTVAGLGNTEVRNINFGSTCGSRAVVDKVKVSVFPNNDHSDDDIRISRVKIDGWTLYSGATNSGQMIDILDYTVSGPAMHGIVLTFTGDIYNKQIVLEMFLKDNLVRTAGIVGDVSSVHQVPAPLGADYFNVNTGNVTLVGSEGNVPPYNQITMGILIEKLAVPIDAVTMTAVEFNMYPDHGEHVTSIKFQDEFIYSDPQGVGSGEPATVNKRIDDTSPHLLFPIGFNSDMHQYGTEFLMIITFSDTSFDTATFKPLPPN